jgi:flagellar biogenesis protein FliO
MDGLSFVPRLLAGLAVVGLVLAALRLLVHELERRGAARRSPRGLLEVVETLWLAPNAALHVVRAGGRCLLISRAAGALGLLCELPSGSVEPVAHPDR